MTTKKVNLKKLPNENMRIKVRSNGSYLVTGGIPLSVQVYVTDDEGLSTGYREVMKYPAMNSYVLCRCGHSQTKPFCDGTHKKVNFDGTETAGQAPFLDQIEEPTIGPEMELNDVINLCANARFCDRAGGVWDNTRASNDPKAKQIAVDEVGYCPAGRLVLWDKEGNAIEPEFEPSIVLIEDPVAGVHGPIWVRGGIPIEAADGSVYEIRNRVTLCRCGHSQNKPFCDGKHVDFKPE